MDFHDTCKVFLLNQSITSCTDYTTLVDHSPARFTLSLRHPVENDTLFRMINNENVFNEKVFPV